MFGLDARIAMAIFAILAVVVGYNAFSRINLAQDAVLVQEITGLDQALRQYQADMGTFFLFTLNKPPTETSSVDDLTALWDINQVKPNFRQRWHGPYFSNETRQSRHFGTYAVFYAQPDRQNPCTTESACLVWLSLNRVPAQIYDNLEKIIDPTPAKQTNDNAINTGRLQADADSNPRMLFFQSVARPGF